MNQSPITEYGKSVKNLASYYYLTVIKSVVKWKRLLLKFIISSLTDFTNDANYENGSLFQQHLF